MRRDPSTPYCDACGRAVRKTPLLIGPDGESLGPGCARKHGVAARQMAVKWQKPEGAPISVFRTPPIANARQMRRPPRALPAVPVEVLIQQVPLWTDDIESEEV